VVGRSVPDIRLFAVHVGGSGRAALEAFATVVPNLHLFYPSGAIIGAERASVHAEFVTGSYLVSSSLYGIGYSILVLGLAMLIFRKRDFV